MCWASLDTNPHLSGYGLYTSLHNYTSKVQPLSLVEKRTMPELYPVGPLLYHHLKILPQLKDCCSGTRTKLTRKDRFMQPANECIFTPFHKDDHWPEFWMNKGWLSGKGCFHHPKLGSFKHREVPTYFPCWNKVLWFQSSRLCSMDGKKGKKKSVEASVISGRTICFPILRFKRFSNSIPYLLITQWMHFHPQEECVCPATLGTLHIISKMAWAFLKWMGYSSQLCNCAMEWRSWLLSPDLWVDQAFFCSREWAS